MAAGTGSVAMEKEAPSVAYLTWLLLQADLLVLLGAVQSTRGVLCHRY